MKIIIGLGNPGPEYAGTRHNAGVMLVDKIYGTKFMNYEYGFRRKKDIFVYESDVLVLVKTANVFMNESGKVMQELKYMNFDLMADNTKLSVAHDDLDIRLGEYKIQMGKGPREHNGVKSVENALGTDRFWRIRIGIDNREPNFDKGSVGGEDYVLQKFLPAERQILDQVLEQAAQELVG